MGSTAEIGDAAIAVQTTLTDAERELGTPLPAWYLSLRDQIHGLVTAAAWATGEPDAATVVGVRCEGRSHTRACVDYRAAAIDYDDTSLTACPKCKAEVHSLFEAGPQPYNCYPCWKYRKCSTCQQTADTLHAVGTDLLCGSCCGPLAKCTRCNRTVLETTLDFTGPYRTCPPCTEKIRN